MLVTRLLAALAVHYFFFIIIIILLLRQIPSPSLYSPPPDVGNCHFSVNNSLPKPPRKWVYSLGTVNTIATVVTILLTLLNILVYKLRQLHDSNSGDNLNVSEELCRRFSLADILSATNHFDDSLVIGRGGFGKVYKGSIDIGGVNSIVAIKRLNSMSKQGAPEFWTEITMLSKFQHAHLVSLLGYCDSNNEMIIVYECMTHGTIADHLYKNDRNNNVTLCWVQRLKICIGAARGLDYLHTGTGTQHRVIHRDVKSSNILLDENCAAKISDFGMSKVGPANQSFTHVSTHVKGTFGYLDPEYLLTRRLTRKSDVYAFGVVLFEVLCGRPAVDLGLHESQRGLALWAKNCVKEGIVERIIDPKLKWEIFPDSLSSFVKIADKCLHDRPKERPTMTEVVAELELALTLQERRDYSMAEEDIFNDCEASDSREIVDSSTKEKVVINAEDSSTKEKLVINVDNGEHQDKKVGTTFHVGRMKLAKKLRLFFSVTHRPISLTASIDPEAAPKNTVAAPNDWQELKHENVVKQLGNSVDGDLRVLAYEYASNGSLYDILHGRKGVKDVQPGPILSWSQRVKIAVGAAKGLKYLHEMSDPHIVHCNIRSSNVFLFEDDVAKIAFTDLSNQAPNMTKHLCSTHVDVKSGYSAPEWTPAQQNFEFDVTDHGIPVGHPLHTRWYANTGKRSLVCNVYSFGVVLLELLTGRKPLDFTGPHEEQSLVTWATPKLSEDKVKQCIDPKLNGEFHPKQAAKMAAVAALCVQYEAEYRPTMSIVVKALQPLLNNEDLVARHHTCQSRTLVKEIPILQSSKKWVHFSLFHF